jgi:hypothetical protein
MINMQEQMQIGFKNISREIRSLSSSSVPQLEEPIEDIQRQSNHRSRVIKDYDDYCQDEFESDDESVVEINRSPEYEDNYLEREENPVEMEAQKKFHKEHKKKIRVCFILFLFMYFYYLYIYLTFPLV